MKPVITCAAVSLSAAVLSGCANVVATTDVKRDGSFTRTTAYAVAQMEGGRTTPGLSENFVLPQGKPWKVTKGVTAEEARCVASWTGPAGSIINRDVSVRAKNNGGVMVTNSMQVSSSSPGTFSYTERLKWMGPRPDEVLRPDPAIVKTVKAALPPELATDRAAAELSRRITISVWRMMFGPGDTIVGDFITQPYAAERNLRRRLGNDVLAQVNASYGSQLTEQQCVAVTRRIVNGVAAMTRARTQGRGAGPAPFASKGKGSEPSTNMPSLTFVLRCPGRILSTNGQVDELAGEIYWTLYPEAAAPEDVVLKATWQVP